MTMFPFEYDERQQCEKWFLLLQSSWNNPHRCCTFSRILKPKVVIVQICLSIPKEKLDKLLFQSLGYIWIRADQQGQCLSVVAKGKAINSLVNLHSNLHPGSPGLGNDRTKAWIQAEKISFLSRMSGGLDGLVPIGGLWLWTFWWANMGWWL